MSGPQNPREYQAIIWTADPTVPGRRVTVWAMSLDEARGLLEKEHGAGNVFYLRNEEDANKPRGDVSEAGSATTWASAAPLLAQLDEVARTGSVAVVKVDGGRSRSVYTVVLSGGRLGEDFFRRDADDLVAVLRDALSWFAERTAPR